MIQVTFKYVRFIGEELIGSLIGSGVSLLGNAIGGKMSEDSSMRMARYMNEYNKPANQIKRLKEAGMNPALALSASLNNVSGNQGSMAQPADYSGLGSLDGAAAGASVSAIKEQNKLLKAQRKGVELDNKLKEVNLPNETMAADALKGLYINVDEDGELSYGMLDADGAFVPYYDKDSKLLPGLHHALMSQNQRELIGRGYLIDAQQYANKRQELENALTEKFGAKNARATIRNLDAAAYQARQSGKSMQLDNDVFENISIGGKSAGLAIDGLKVLLSVLRGKK